MARHYHVYIAGDNPGRKGPPRAFLRRGLGYKSRAAAHRAADRIEPDPERRLILKCDRPNCRMAVPGRNIG